MKKFWKNVKPVLRFLFTGLLVFTVSFLLIRATHSNQASAVSDVQIFIEESNEVHFITKEDVQQYLLDQQLKFSDSIAASQLDIRKVEQALELNPYVLNAEVNFSATHSLNIFIVQRTPILRIINSNGVSYYMDEFNEALPLSATFTAHVPIATGNALTNEKMEKDSLIRKNLYQLAHTIYRDSFMAALTDHILYNSSSDIQLVPRIGRHTILLGDIGSLETKFSKLKEFYRQVIGKTDWHQYKMIDLRFANLVYATRKQTVLPSSSTALTSSQNPH
jgi:cell division protein FtsQ